MIVPYQTALTPDCWLLWRAVLCRRRAVGCSPWILDILPQGGIPRMRDGYWIFGLGFVPSSFVLFSLDIGHSVLVIGYSVLVIGYSVLVIGYSTLNLIAMVRCSVAAGIGHYRSNRSNFPQPNWLTPTHHPSQHKNGSNSCGV